MHFTSQQLRTLQAPFEPEPSPPLQPLDPYGKDQEVATMLSALVTEWHILRLSNIPLSGQDMAPMSVTHKRTIKQVGCDADVLPYRNYHDDLKSVPKGIIEFDGDDVRLTPRGEVTLALGGALISKVGIPNNVALGNWTGNRSSRSTLSTSPQMHRLHIMSILRPPSRQLTIKQIARLSGDRLSTRNASIHTKHMYELGKPILDKVRCKKDKRQPHFEWRLNRRTRDITHAFLDTVAVYSEPTADDVSDGIDAIREIQEKKMSRLAELLFARGKASGPHGSRPEYSAFNDELITLFSNLPNDALLSASGISNLLGYEVTTARLKRLLDCRGIPVGITCVDLGETHNPRYWFKKKEIDLTHARFARL